MTEIFEINLKTNLKNFEEEVTASSFSEIMKGEANKVAGNTKEEPPVTRTVNRRTRY